MRPPVNERVQASLRDSFDKCLPVSEAAREAGVHRNTASHYYAEFRGPWPAISIEVPTADDAALAIVTAAREYGENPIDVISGTTDIQCRQAAYCGLELCFPDFSKHALLRFVGAPRNFLTTFERGRSKQDRAKRQRVQHIVAGAIAALHPDAEEEAPPPATSAPDNRPFRLCDNYERPTPRPLGGVVTGEIMGDPSPERSALAQRLEQGEPQ